MAEENKNVETLEGQGTEEQKEQSQPEKKYTDEEVNNISVKNSKKAVAKLMNILYECKKKPPAYSRGLGYNCPVACFSPMAIYTVYAIPIQVSSNLKMQQSACRFTIDARLNREH